MRAFPGADVFEDRVLVVDRRAADGIEQIAARGAGEGAEGDRRVRRTERCQADLRHRPAGQRGDRGQCVQIGGLALIGRHARRGVTLHMLDRAKAFAGRDGEVLGRDVVLEVDERFAVRPARRRRERQRRISAHAGDVECSGLAAARAVSFGEAGGQIECSGAGADGLFMRGRLSGQKRSAAGIEAKLAARLRKQVHRRRPAIRHQHRITMNDPRSAVGPHETNAPPPARAGDPRAGVDRNSGRARLFAQRRIDLRPPVEDRRDPWRRRRPMRKR